MIRDDPHPPPPGVQQLGDTVGDTVHFAFQVQRQVALEVVPESVDTPTLCPAAAIGSRAKVDKRRIHVASPIKALGEYQVKVSLHGDLTATVDVHVVAAS